MTFSFRTISLAVLVFCGAAAVAAQTPPPPPPPLVRGGPPLDGRKYKPPFESKEGGFKIEFPALPVVQNRDSETSFGKTVMTSYVLPTSLAVYNVVHVDFPTAIKEKFDLDTRFDMMRDNQAKRTNGRVTTDSELYYGTHYGRDLVIEDLQSTNWIRVIMVEQRLFVITVQTRGAYTTQSDVLKTANEARVKKFFHSFVVTEIPKPLLTVVELPSDFGVSVTGSTFSSRFLNISLEIPKDWSVLESAETEQLAELGKQSLVRSRPRLAEYLKNGNSRILLAVSKSSLETSLNPAIFIVGAEKSQYPNFLPLSAAKTFIGSFIDKTDKVIKEPKLERIGGIDFAWVETFDAETKQFQRMYFANRKGMALEFALTYTDAADLQPMLRSIETFMAK